MTITPQQQAFHSLMLLELLCADQTESVPVTAIYGNVGGFELIGTF